MSAPDAQRISTHEVLPPYRAVVGPGFAMDPLVPQNVISIACDQNTPPGFEREGGLALWAAGQ